MTKKTKRKYSNSIELMPHGYNSLAELTGWSLMLVLPKLLFQHRSADFETIGAGRLSMFAKWKWTDLKSIASTLNIFYDFGRLPSYAPYVQCLQSV